MVLQVSLLELSADQMGDPGHRAREDKIWITDVSIGQDVLSLPYLRARPLDSGVVFGSSLY